MTQELIHAELIGGNIRFTFAGAAKPDAAPPMRPNPEAAE
jgi:hypothetical protein